MAEITYKRTGDLLRQLFTILMPLPDGLRAREAIQALEAAVALTPYEMGEFPSGGRRFDKIVRFATVDCVKAGWLTKHKGTWSVTEAGQQAYKQYVDGEAFYRHAVKLYQAWKAGQPGSVASAGGFTKDADEYARSHSKRRMTLVDIDRLVDLWVEFYNKLDDSARRRFPLTPVWFLTPQT